MTRPHTDTHQRIREAAAHMADIARLWESYVRQMNDHVPGIKSTLGGGGRRGSGVSDPTGQTVAALDERPDPLLATHHRLMCDLTIILSMIEDARAKITATTNPIAPSDRNRPVYCRQIGCDTVIETRMSDYHLTPDCPACHRYVVEHQTAMVPARVLADRRRKREARQPAADTSAPAAAS